MRTPLFWMKFICWYKGRQDGKDGIPPENATASPQWETELRNRYESTVREIAERFDSEESVLCQKYKATIEKAVRTEMECKEIAASLKKHGRNQLDSKIRVARMGSGLDFAN